jgi:ketosteroid isomerase-like protein
VHDYPVFRDTTSRIVPIIAADVDRYLADNQPVQPLRLHPQQAGQNMTLDLPSPIAAYVDANARLDTDGMLNPFAPDAVLLDNGAAFRGQAEIRRLIETAVVPVKAIFMPDALRHENGQVVVEGPAHGDFKGSPIRFTYRFTLENDAIKALEITA